MIAPTFDHGNGSLYFVIAVILMWCASVLDVLVTRAGIWYHSQTEANPIYKLLPAAVRKFLFNTAAGSFVDAAIRFAMCIGFVVAIKAIGYADNAHSYLPFAMAGGIGGLVLRNWLSFRKIPLTKTIGQVS
jgi:hypothetical protein